MGVRRLETYAERNPEICFDVDLKELVASYIKEEKKKPVIVLDMLSIISIYSGIASVAGGQVKEVVATFAKFYESLENLGAEVVTFADGVIAPTKEETYIQRREVEIKDINLFFDVLKADQFSIFEKFFKHSSNAQWSVKIYLLNRNLKYAKSLLECDLEMAKYAFENDCFAILAQDTDFLIYRGARHYLSMKHFDMLNMKTKEYLQKNLAKVLGLRIEDLPILSSLIGNDIIKQEELMNFHSSLSENRYRIDYYENFKKVANFISYNISHGKSYNEALTKICTQVFGTADYPKFRQSLQIYDTKYPHKGFPIDENLGEGWIQVQELARDLYIQGRITTNMFNVILGVPLFNGPYMEDFIEKPFLPAHVLGSRLRKRIYGVLLQEKPLIDHIPHTVEELNFSGFGPNRLTKLPAIRPEFRHRGLVNLWRSHDEGVYAEKMSLFRFCLGIGKDITGLEERHLIVPTASIKYLFDEGFKILKWEFEALIVAIVSVDFYSVEELREIPEFPIDTRAINLFTVFAKCCISTIEANLSCGSPLSLDECNPARHHDGKLFQSKYRKAKEQRNDFDKLCENNETVITTSKKIINILKKSFLQ